MMLRNFFWIFFLFFFSLGLGWSNGFGQTYSNLYNGLFPVKVKEVKVLNNFKIPASYIKSVVSLKKEKVTLEDIDKALHNLFSTGYFGDIKMYLRPFRSERENGSWELIVYVKELPEIRKIIFKGNKEFSEEELKDIVKISENETLSLQALLSSVKAIKEMYKSRGYYDVKVSYFYKKVNPTQVDVTFKIKEGHKLYIKKIVFVGNKFYSSEELKKHLLISEKKSFLFFRRLWWRIKNFFKPGYRAEPGVFSEAFLKKSLFNLEKLYKDTGFADATIGEPDVKREKDGVIITIPIYEGPRYKIGKIQVIQKFFSEKKVRQALKIKSGEYFSLSKIEATRASLFHLFADYGYPYAQVLVLPEKHPDKKIINLNFKINKGPVVYINRVEIVGNTKTRDKVIRRQLLVVEGWPYSLKRIELSKERLYKLGFFKNVDILQKPQPDNKMKIIVKVKERPTGTLMIGGGYSNIDKFFFMGKLSERNFLGTGKEIALSLRFSKFENQYSLSYMDPYLFDSHYFFKTSLYRKDTEYTDFKKESWGISFTLGRSLGLYWHYSVGYKLEKNQVTQTTSINSTAIEETKNINLLSEMIWDLYYDSRNRYFFPTKGMYHGWNLEYPAKWLGSDTDFVKITGLHHYYRPLPFFSKLTFHIKTGYGWLSNENVPLYARFFLGGLGSVRGYRYGDVTVKDPETGENIGGTRMAYTQFELIFPLASGIRGVVFLDAGEVWDREVPFEWSRLKKSWGFGIRILTPLAPMRFEWGFNIDPAPGDEKGNFNFMIGGEF